MRGAPAYAASRDGRASIESDIAAAKGRSLRNIAHRCCYHCWQLNGHSSSEQHFVAVCCAHAIHRVCPHIVRCICSESRQIVRKKTRTLPDMNAIV